MGRIPDSVIADVQSATDIVELISPHVPLKRSGKSFKGLCPFHQEKTPSFHVDSVRQFYHCFGCGAGGTVFTWVMKQEGVAFPEAVRRLADRAGIRVPEEASADGAAVSRRQRLIQVNQWAADRFQEALRQESGDVAKAYFKKRGVTGATALRFRLGYATPAGALLKWAERDGIDREALEEAGLAGRREDGRWYEMFRHRVIFPILDAREQVVGFGGRTLGDAEPKYLNTPQNAVFQKGALLYGFPEARKEVARRRQALVVEGYMDCLMAHQHGVGWTVATLGTALTEDHARLLSRHAERVTLVFDPDPAGLRAALRSLGVFARTGLDVRIAVLPGTEDPSDFLTARGPTPFLERIDAAEGVVAFRLRQARAAGEWDAPEGRSRVVRELVGWAAASDDAIRREMILREICEKTGLSADVVRAEADRLAGRARPAARPLPRRSAADRVGKIQRDLLRFLLEPAYAGRVGESVTPEDFAGGRYATLAERWLALWREGRLNGPRSPSVAESVEEGEILSEILAVTVDVSAQKESCDRWVEDSLRLLREERRRRALENARARLRGTDLSDPAVDEALARAQRELSRKT